MREEEADEGAEFSRARSGPCQAGSRGQRRGLWRAQSGRGPHIEARRNDKATQIERDVHSSARRDVLPIARIPEGAICGHGEGGWCEGLRSIGPEPEERRCVAERKVGVCHEAELGARQSERDGADVLDLKGNSLLRGVGSFGRERQTRWDLASQERHEREKKMSGAREGEVSVSDAGVCC